MKRHAGFAARTFCGVLGLLAAQSSQAAWRETDEAIKSRGDVTVKVLIARAVANKDAAPALPTDIAIFFPGADGKVRDARSGLSEHRANPSTMGLLAEKLGMAVAVGLPSDHPNGVSLAWRMGAAHVGDGGAVIDALALRFPKARISLIGMSAGGYSVTRVAAAVVRRGAPKLHGVVVMSTAPEALADDTMQPLREARVPVLVMHHVRDSCLPLRDIEPLAKRYDFVAIDDARQPRLDALSGIRNCNPGSAHVFGGKEDVVYSTIAEWSRSLKVKAAD